MLNEKYLEIRNNLIEQLKIIDEQLSHNTKQYLIESFQEEEKKLHKSIDDASQIKINELTKKKEKLKVAHDKLPLFKKIADKKIYNDELNKISLELNEINILKSSEKHKLTDSYNERADSYIKEKEDNTKLMYTKKEELERLIKAIDSNEISLSELGLDEKEITAIICDKYNIINDTEISFTMIDPSIDEDYLKSMQISSDRKNKTLDNEVSNNDTILIRTTDIFPTNGKINSVSNSSYIAKSNTVINSYFVIANALSIKRFSLEYNNLNSKEKDQIKNEIKEKFTIYHRNFRSTIHFTVNGLVGSHMYGDFSNRAFIIADPLKNHINDSNLINLIPEDTFFKGDVKLSSDAAILMNITVYNSLISNPIFKETIKNLKLFLFTGDETKATEMFIVQLGYAPETISDHGYAEYRNNTFASKMNDYLITEGKRKNIISTKHCYSKDYLEDDRVNMHFIPEDDEAFLNYIINNTKIDDQLQKELYDNRKKYLNNAIINNASVFKECDIEYEIIFNKLINSIGLEQYENLVNEFNILMKEKYKNNSVITYEKEAESKEENHCLV